MLGWWLATLYYLTNQQCPPLCCHSSGDTSQATKPHQYSSKRFMSLASSLHHYKTPSLPSAPLFPYLVGTRISITMWVLANCCAYCWFTTLPHMDKKATYIGAKAVNFSGSVPQRNKYYWSSMLRYSLTSMEPPKKWIARSEFNLIKFCAEFCAEIAIKP